jgi:hypothetical protein
MGGATLPRKAAKAFRSAGATEEIIAAARLIYGSLPNEPRGRPRLYKTGKEADHAFYMRHRDRFRRKRVISPNNAESEEAARERRIAQLVEAALPPRAEVPNGEDTHVLTLEEVKAIHPATGIVVPRVTTKDWLLDAARSNADRGADIAPIEALLAQGCDLEADVLPTVARMVPELPRPLKNWGAQWLVREILAARDRRLFPSLVLRKPLADEDGAVTNISAALKLRLRRPPDACRPWTGTNLSRGTARAS